MTRSDITAQHVGYSHMSDFVVDKVEKETTFLGAVSKSYSSCRHANVPQRFCCLQNKSISIQNVWGQAGPRSPGISTHLIVSIRYVGSVYVMDNVVHFYIGKLIVMED
jgi:hypothetical protein